MSQVFRALSDPTRRRVLQLLRNGPMSAGELSNQFDVSKPTMSAHFATLREADLVHAEKAGKSRAKEFDPAEARDYKKADKG